MEDCYLDFKRKYAVVVPVHNSERTLEELFQRTARVITELSDDFAVVFVDDYSNDNSWEVIRKLKDEHPQQVIGVRLSRNFGQHNATLCGIKHAQAEIIITIDDDLEFHPEDITNLLALYATGEADVIYGVDEHKKTNARRDLLTTVFRKIQLVADKKNIRGSSFRLINGGIARAITNNSREFSFIDEFLQWYTSRISVVKVTTGKPSVKSRYRIASLLGITKNLIFLSSTLPLKMVTTLGFYVMFFNFLAGIIIIFRRLVFTIDVKGYTSIVVAILFSSGAIMFCIGIVAEYIGKILKMNYNKPSYFESEIL